MMVDRERGDLQLSIRQFLVPCQSRAVVTGAPNRAGRVIAIDVSAVEFR